MNYIRTKGEVCRQLKICLTPRRNPPPPIHPPLPTVVYVTARYKAVDPVLFLILCSFVVYTTGRLKFLSLLMLFVLVSPVCFSILTTSLGEEGSGLCASRTFVCLCCACTYLSFSLPLCVESCLLCDCGIPLTFLLSFRGQKITRIFVRTNSKT